MAEVTHLPNHHAALAAILKELDWAYESSMILVDLIGDIQADSEWRVDYTNLRATVAKRLVKSLRTRDAAIAVLDGKS